MQKKKELDELTTYIINTRSHLSYSSRGEIISSSTSNIIVNEIATISKIIGRMEAYEVLENTSYFDNAYKELLSYCELVGIDMSDFEDWYESRKEMYSDDSNDDNDDCLNCVNDEE